MSVFPISSRSVEQILADAGKISRKDMRILYLLRNIGPQKFTTVIENSGLSRSTVSKYLQYHLSQNNVEKRLYINQSQNIQETRYFITDLGIEKLGSELYLNKEIIFFNEASGVVSRLTGLVKFYVSIGVADSIINQIIKVILNVGEKYFELEQNHDLYLSLFYIYLNSVLTRDFKFEINEFCKHYNVKKIKIDYHIDKIMSNKLGFYMFSRGDDIFFFHEEDILGKNTMQLIKDRLTTEIIRVNLDSKKQSINLDLDKLSEDISCELIKQDYIWEAIKEPFEILIEKMVIKFALDLGVPKTSLWDMSLLSAKLSKPVGGTLSVINIIEGSKRYEDLNLVSISEPEDSLLDNVLGDIEGFCSNCGKSIWKKDITNPCPRCGISFDAIQLTKDINKASEISVEYRQKSLVEEQEIECPNPNCTYRVKIGWGECPQCGTSLRF
jgi:DNA-binding Lrp family transcriptional regulator